MCGIVGIISQEPVVTDILEALRRLEYRGYDSAGIAVLTENTIENRRAVGKLSNLDKKLQSNPLHGLIGIGHTRWATHGEASELNAHPHTTDKVAIVHNGIIENFEELREQLAKQGYTTTTQTDTEVIAKLLTSYLDQNFSMKESLQKTLAQLHGAFALAIISSTCPHELYFARRGSPLVVGQGEGSFYIGSDAIALAPYTPHVIYPEEGDWGYITQNSCHIFNKDNQDVERDVHTLNLNHQIASKGSYRHFMEKEIFEQPRVLKTTLDYYIDVTTNTLTTPDLPFDPSTLRRLTIVACGTSYYAGCIAKYWLERYTGIPVDVDIASEFRYRNPALGTPQEHGCIFISQSGETIDTLAALRYVKEAKLPTIGIVNVTHSAIARETQSVWPTFAGAEIGVASTKAFTCQLMTLACFVAKVASTRGTLQNKDLNDFLMELKSVPSWMENMNFLRQECLEGGHLLEQAQDVLYLGRGTNFPLALEGALKLKEISYIHAEAYAAGEMKHGPIALIDNTTPVVALMPNDNLVEKTISNLQEAYARGAQILAIGDEKSLGRLGNIATSSIHVPAVPPLAQPFIMALPIQLLAYETAVLKGTDVDQPRNLAKSVTVE